MYYIGIDLGTSAVKLLLMDSDGKIVNIVSREYPLYFPRPGWSEQKPEDWYEQTVLGIRELIRDVDKSQVAGISFGGQMHGGDRLSQQCHRKGKAVGIYGEYCLCRLYGPQDSLGKKQRTGKFCTDFQDHAAQGLYRL